MRNEVHSVACRNRGNLYPLSEADVSGRAITSALQAQVREALSRCSPHSLQLLASLLEQAQRALDEYNLTSPDI
jgi:hypothetical protein